MYKKLIEKVKTIVYEAAGIIDDIKKPRVNEKGINDFVTEVDIKISQFLCDKLPKLVKESVALSEEGSIVNPEKGYYWVIDPIDGTSNFIYGIPDYGISVALLKNGKPVLGVVYAPKKDEMYYAAEGLGAFCNGKPIQVCQDEHIKSTLILSETNPYSDRETNMYTAVFGELFKDCIDYRITGSAALD